MRLFTAILLPDDVRQHLTRLVHHWQRSANSTLEANYGLALTGVRWVREENLHATLAFLGEVPEPDVPQICEALRAVERPGSIHLRASYVDCLPPRGPVRVIAAGLVTSREMPGKLDLLYSGIVRALEGFVSKPNRDTLRPHVTLGRSRFPLRSPVREILSSSAEKLLPGPDFTVERFALMSSDLRPTGPVYTPLATFPIS